MQEIFAEFNAKLSKILNEIPNARRELHEEISELLKREIDTNIDSSINDSNGKIKGWQEAVVGSGGGYAAIHAVSGESGANSPGAITNYLEGGHPIRSATGRSKYYKPRIKVAYVDGFHFYARTRDTIEAKVISLAEKFADSIVKNLE